MSAGPSAPPREAATIPAPVELVRVTDAGGPYSLAAGPDGAVWVTLVYAGAIARVDRSGSVDVVRLDSATCRPSQIASAPDGALWFTRAGDDRIGRVTVQGEATSFALDPGSGPFGISVGPDEAIWFTAMGTDRIGRITLGGEVDWVDLPTAQAMPSLVTTGPDGALWATLNAANALVRVDPGRRRPQIHPLPTPDSGPVGIAADGNAVWFVELAAGQVGRIDDRGELRELPLPDRRSRPHAVVGDLRGGCWFTEWATSRVGHLTKSGEVSHVELPPESEPHGLAIDPDGRIWVALETGEVARINPESGRREAWDAVR